MSTATPTEQPTAETTGWQGAAVHTKSVNPLVAVPPGVVSSVPAGVLDVVVAGSPKRGEPGYAKATSYTPTTGAAAGGTTVTITGKDFTGQVVAITFGGVAATNVTVTNDTTITCRTPAHAAGQVDVVVAGTKLGTKYTYT